MTIEEINNYFGDMDLFLMDSLLKGHLPNSGSVLDLGCGEGRNAVFFIRNGYHYVGVDKDTSKLRLLEYVTSTLTGSKADFMSIAIEDLELKSSYDIIICSRVLHFVQSRSEFDMHWAKIVEATAPGSTVYLSMDSVVDSSEAKKHKNGNFEFPDGRVSFALTNELYKEMKQSFNEVEPLRTLTHHQARTQSFMLLRRH